MKESSDILKETTGELGVKAVAGHLKVSPQTVYKWIESKEGSGTRNPLDRVRDIVDVTGNMSPVHWLCQSYSGSFVLDKPTEEDFSLQKYLEYHANITKKMSDLSAVMFGAIIGEQRIDQDEYEEIRDAWSDVQNLLNSFVHTCKIWADEYEQESDSSSL